MDFVTLLILLLLGHAAWKEWLAYRNHRALRRFAATPDPDVLATFPEGYRWKREVAYRTAHGRAGMIAEIWETGLLAAVLASGLLQALARWSAGIAEGPFLPGLLFGALCALAVVAAGLPQRIWTTFVLERRFGFSHESLGHFARNSALAALLAALLGGGLLGLLALFAGMGPLWPLWGFLGTEAATLLLTVLFPVAILPLFYRLRPLEEGTLKEAIRQLFAETPFASRGISVADESTSSTHLNGMVSGLGKAKRIILFDTLLQRVSEEGIVAVVAHELGHAVHGHIRQRFLLATAQYVLLFGVAGLLWDLPWVTAAAPALPVRLVLVFLFAGTLMELFTGSLTMGFARRQEFQADTYAARKAGHRATYGVLSRLANHEMSWIPDDPLYARWNRDHPTLPERLRRLGTPPAEPGEEQDGEETAETEEAG
ncbi:MAG: M48 family metallopeptidase [Synergistales bacterium]|nr:M48 family metallopeptidase [Synergistales bacterium]